MKTTKTSDTKRYEVIKLGIDAHARDYHVCRQVEGATPQAVQKMNLEALLRFVAKQLEQAQAENKSGNLRVRSMLVEMTWRLIRWQPGYHALRKWQPVLCGPSRNPAARKKAVVAIARQLAVELWRLFTGQTKVENLGLTCLAQSAP